MAEVRSVIMELPNLQPAPGLLESGHVDAIVAPSEFALAKVLKNVDKIIDARKNNYVVIPPGIDTKKMFVVRNNEDIRNTYDHRFRIGFVARLAPEKSPGIFLKTA